MSDLNDDQIKIHDYVMDWFKSSRGRYRLLTFGGYAGTGKTYTLGKICKTLSQEQSGTKIGFLTFTGKASTVLLSKIKPFMRDTDYCGTIHSVVYVMLGEIEKNGRKIPVYGKRATKPDLDLIIIDEASMVSQKIFDDIFEYNIPILAVGDHGQLPPVKETFNLMENPDMKLEKIIRQAEGNPIIHMARLAREEGKIEYGDYGQGCIKTRNIEVLHQHQYDSLESMMLCALNQTRNKMNAFARGKLGIASIIPINGEPVICLLNNRSEMIFNGNIGTLKSFEIIDEATANICVDLIDREFNGFVDIEQFGKKYLDKKDAYDLNYFDWAYCITVWKSQGSEWKNILLMEEYIPSMDDDIRRKFLYTACTRAREKLVIFKR